MFIGSLGATSLGSLLGPAAWADYHALSPGTLATEERFWALLRSKYVIDPDFINLEHGYYSIQSTEVLDAFIDAVRYVNRLGSYYMRTAQAHDKEETRRTLAMVAGCAPEEVIITRNTTESLDTVIAGHDWKPGDEAVMAAQDYGAMLDQFALQARRFGVVNRIVSLPNHPRSDAEIIELYAGAITPRTRLLLLSHVVNITGQILPVRKIVDMAHARNVRVAVDGAHAFAHVDYQIPGTGADFYAASLHKWLGAPLGAGLLYVRRDRIADLRPLFADSSFADDDIRKLNHTGTHPVHTDLAIRQAIALHSSLGSARKEARLRYLQRYWTSQVRNIRKVMLNTPEEAHRAAGIANFSIEGIPPMTLAEVLFSRYRIWTVGIERENVHGVRVTPHLYTTPAELDSLVNAIRQLAA